MVGGWRWRGVGLNLAARGMEAALGHFKHFLPPRLARVEALAERANLLTVVGPGAAESLAAVVGTVPREGYALVDGGPLQGGVLVARGLRQIDSWDLWGSGPELQRAWDGLRGAGATAVGAGAWQTLRIEAGLPEFGTDMDDSTIPIEAGLGECAFDHKKGCYTGQEVIVRIRHRGRVNWHLRSLRFGEMAARPGMKLFEAGGAKVRGRVTSVANSPRFGQVIGLGYVRREVEVPATLRLGSGEGGEVGVE